MPISIANQATIDLILSSIPQQYPFRFIDKILELSNESCVGEYTFKNDEYFYKGHFPGNPITPGVILTECMAQIGLVPIGIYEIMLKNNTNQFQGNIFFSEAQVSFQNPVPPGTTVIVKSKKKFFRHKKMQAEVTMENAKKEILVDSILSGFLTGN